MELYECNIEDTVPNSLATLATFHVIRLLKPIEQKSIIIGWLKKESIMKRK